MRVSPERRKACHRAPLGEGWALFVMSGGEVGIGFVAMLAEVETLDFFFLANADATEGALDALPSDQ